MSTLQTLYFGGVVAYCNGGAVDGSLPPSETTNGPGGVSRGLVWTAKKDMFITDIAVHNRHTADAALVIAQTPGGVFYNVGTPNHNRRTVDTGMVCPAGLSFDALAGRRYSLRAGEGFIVLTNIAFFGVSAIIIDIIGEAN